jgi:hypothetical protein
MMASSEPITTNHHLFASSIGNHSLTHPPLALPSHLVLLRVVLIDWTMVQHVLVVPAVLVVVCASVAWLIHTHVPEPYMVRGLMQVSMSTLTRTIVDTANDDA